MNICKIDVSNFRGIKNASILVSKNAVFVGDNNSGKSTLFEAIDLVMGPDRLSRSPVIDEHDFYAGEYLANDTPVQIKIEVTVSIVVLGTPKEWNVSRRNFTPTFFFSFLWAAAALW